MKNIIKEIIIIAEEILKVNIEAKDKPKTLFEQSFYNLRNEMKDLKHDAALKVIKKIEDSMHQDLTQKGYIVKDLELKLGRFRGNDYISSAKLHIVTKNEESQTFLNYLQSTFSPKFKLKKIENGVEEFNIR